MQPFKLIACLVTLLPMCGTTLQAATLQEFRQWTDTTGRTITARLVESPSAQTIKIERQDGQFFNVALKTFSAEDQAYVMAFRAGKTMTAAAPTAAKPPVPLTRVPPSTWTLLNTAGDQPAWTYEATALNEVISGINRQLTEKNIKTTGGRILQVRTEPADLADRAKITGILPDMTMGAFVREIAQISNLTVQTDAAGMVVLVDTTPPVAAPKPVVTSFLGVPVAPP